MSLAILVTLSLLSRVEHRLFDPCRLGRLRIVYRPSGGKAQARIQGVLDEASGPIQPVGERELPDGRRELEIRYCPIHRAHRAIAADLADLDEVDGLIATAAEKAVGEERR